MEKKQTRLKKSTNNISRDKKTDNNRQKTHTHTNRVKLSNRFYSLLLSILDSVELYAAIERQTAAHTVVVIAHPWRTINARPNGGIQYAAARAPVVMF